MALSEEKAAEIMRTIVGKAKMNINIVAAVYRQDTWDYFVVLDKDHYTEVREKLLSDYLKTSNHDTFNEILFKLKHPMDLEDWQKEDLGLAQEEADAKDNQTAIDDSQKNDWA